MNSLVIPLYAIAQEIIQKYEGGIPRGMQLHQFNKKIKEIGRIAGIDDEILLVYKRGTEKQEKTFKKYELMASHTCRRSFCTNEYLKGTPSIFIMKISGHKTEKAFLKYIKIDEQLAAKKILELWKTQKV